MDFDRQRLLHCIVSHHGQPEYGSPMKPMTGEAILLHLADDTSAKMSMVTGALAADTSAAKDWSDRVPGLDNSIWLRAAREAQDYRANESDDDLDDMSF